MAIDLKYCSDPSSIEVSLWSEIPEVKNVFTAFFCRPENIGLGSSQKYKLPSYQNEVIITLMETIKESDDAKRSP